MISDSSKIWIVDVGIMSKKKAYSFMQKLMLEKRDQHIQENNLTGYKKIGYKLWWWMKHEVI